MVIPREEMQGIVKSYRKPIWLNLGSHSALDAWHGQCNCGLRSIIYTTPEGAHIYLQNPWWANRSKLLKTFQDKLEKA